MKHIFLLLAACASATLFGAADDVAEIEVNSGIVKVYTAAESNMQCQLKFHRTLEETRRIIACLIADEHPAEGAAAHALEQLIPLNLSSLSTSTDQYAKIKQAIQPAAKWTAVFVIEREAIFGEFDISLYMRVLNKTTTYNNLLRKSLYCRLNNEGQPLMCHGESNMANEIWDEAGGLGPNDVGFEVDIEAIKQELAEGRCIIL
jgi:hypothetical protein